MDALSQELEEFFRRTESQFLARVNLFGPSFEPVPGQQGFRCESNYEGAAHFGYHDSDEKGEAEQEPANESLES